MKLPILNLIATILFVGIIFQCGHRVVFASTFSVITGLGKELAKSVLFSPLATLNDLRRGRNSEYGVRSMIIGGFNVWPSRSASALPAKEAERVFKREQRERDRIIGELREVRERKRKLAQKSTPDPTDFIVYWRGIYKSGFWFYRMYTARNAKKKLTKAEEARRQEYFCGDNDEEKLKEYCAKSISENTPFFEENGWKYDPDESAKCELKSIILDQYDYVSQRGVLTCPIVVSREGESDEHTVVYISSIDDPPKNRLSFYVFTEADESIDEHAQKFPHKDTRSTSKPIKKADSQSSGVFKNIRPAMTMLKAATSPNKILTKSLLLPASTFAVRTVRNMDSGGVRSYVPFLGSKKTKNPELTPPGKPLKLVSLVVNKKP